MFTDYCLNPKTVLEEALRKSERTREDFKVNKFVILTFSNNTLNCIKKMANCDSKEWLMPYHPYASAKIHHGNFEGTSISTLVPPMGASPMASIIEDLIYLGAKFILLSCGAWGIGKDVKLLDFIIPNKTGGTDCTSTSYGMNIEEEINIENDVIESIKHETMNFTNKVHIGKNYAKEALYRITKTEIRELRSKGYISMENGELNVISKICSDKGVKFGAIFYNYIDLLNGWNIPWGTDNYKKCTEMQAKISLLVSKSFSHLAKSKINR